MYCSMAHFLNHIRIFSLVMKVFVLCHGQVQLLIVNHKNCIQLGEGWPSKP
ncbi:hypothetical protein M758_10G094100 [Ceratodon purpureus]|uniref:Uncharacterized protein n=1 Tax=Ceratodon purpureus TaxID=3225 RepID=A0A8T0GM80_CERPU|nr:hypothetical protein KC19_10G095500 [Ceratodon purpureus]KAG0603436.1 hypothetical protein M758_10G094100 [Ceratodon purpureus]